jgi:hypothetical protein
MEHQVCPEISEKNYSPAVKGAPSSRWGRTRATWRRSRRRRRGVSRPSAVSTKILWTGEQILYV